MKLRLFNLRYDPAVGGFDESELHGFLAEREVLHVFEHLVQHEGPPTWAVLVGYREERDPGAPRPAQADKPDWRAELDDAEWQRFEALRQWRNDRAQRDGRPAYVLFTNRELAAIARAAPADASALGRVEGVGRAKIDSYGVELLALLASLREERPRGE